MRCLTLAKVMSQAGHLCSFICRDHPGHMAAHIQAEGFICRLIPLVNITAHTNLLSANTYTSWLGDTVNADAAFCRDYFCAMGADWFISDHYGIDSEWINALDLPDLKIMIIDDLANRKHTCDILLDQNLGRNIDDYAHLVPKRTTILTGPSYALLRPEFHLHRPTSNSNKQHGNIHSILISLGGVDQKNDTQLCLDALDTLSLSKEFHIRVVMGGQSIWLDAISERASNMRHKTTVLSQVSNMAQLMADSDLAIGAGGISAWERCCLGLPTLAIVAAENQRPGLEALQKAGVVLMLDTQVNLPEQISMYISSLQQGNKLQEMVNASLALVDGHGVNRVLKQLLS
jgi:UDP-2,4-diacetamido-2,4,6-trideoxy-beta-L-altropyranose hydrolase